MHRPDECPILNPNWYLSAGDVLVYWSAIIHFNQFRYSNGNSNSSIIIDICRLRSPLLHLTKGIISDCIKSLGK